MLVAWISTISSLVLVILTGIYVILTHSIAIAGKEPILIIGNYGVINILFHLDLKNISEHFAKDIKVQYLRIDGRKLTFNGPKVLFPRSDGKDYIENYKCTDEPKFDIVVGDKIVITYKSILGKSLSQVWEYKKEENFLDQNIPAGFKLVDIGKI